MNDRVYNLRGRQVHAYSASNADLDTGTETNQHTRDFVNNRSPQSYGPAPQQVSFSWASGDQSGSGGFMNTPPSQGTPWDAGHLLARQNGGLGQDANWVFPQNPSQNRGGVWRQGEQAFHDAVQTQGQGQWTATTYDKPRQPYVDDPTLDPKQFFGRYW